MQAGRIASFLLGVALRYQSIAYSMLKRFCHGETGMAGNHAATT